MDNKPNITPHTWTGPEYNHSEKSIDWLWTIGLLAIVGFIITLFFHSYVFGIFILVSGASLIFFSVRNPDEVSFTLTNDGITIGKKDYPYKNLKGFKIKEGVEWAKLLVMTDAKFLPILTLPLPEASVSEAYDILIQVVPELPLEESPSMLFMEKLGF
jgi:hypothetical protein